MPEREPLTSATTPDDFRRAYWLKEELVAFCRQHHISTGGSKIEIAARVEQFLITHTVNDVDEPRRPSAAKRPRSAARQDQSATLNLSTVIPENYTNSQANRAFFTAVIGARFHFTTAFMAFMKNSAGKTYQDAVDAWLRLEAEAKQGNQHAIAPQFEYNRHIREFFAAHPGATLSDAIAAWEAKKAARNRAPDASGDQTDQ